jgi:hypothetical protein
VKADEVVLQKYPSPATAVKPEVLTEDWKAIPADGVIKDNTPEPFVLNTCPLVPSVAGSVNVKSADKEAGADNET